MKKAGCITLAVLLSMAVVVMGGSGPHAEAYALPDEVSPDEILTEISDEVETVDTGGEFDSFRFTPTKLRDNEKANSVQVAEIIFRENDENVDLDECKTYNPGGRNPRNEEPDKVDDADVGTKFLDFNKGFFMIECPKPMAINKWTWVTANDATERDPVQWKLEGKLADGKWEVMSEQKTDFDVPKDRRKQLDWFSIDGVSPPPPPVIARKSTKKEKATLKAIVALRAYAIAAKDTLSDYMDANGKSSDAGLVNFLSLFGDVKYAAPVPPPSPNLPNREGEKGYVKDLPVVLPSDANKPGAPKKVIIGNVVMDYAAALGKSKKQFSRGFGEYLLDALDANIMKGVDVTTQKKAMPTVSSQGAHAYRSVVMLDHKKFGLVKKPIYFDHVSAPKADFFKSLANVEAAATHSDTEAAAEWLHNGGVKEYKSFLQKEQEASDEKADTYNDMVQKKVVAAMHKKFTQGNHEKTVRGMIHAGQLVLEDIDDLKLPTEALMKEKAEKAAQKWKLNKNKVSEPEVVEQMHVAEEEAMTDAPTPVPTPAPTAPCDAKGTTQAKAANLGQIPAQCVPAKRVTTGKNYVYATLKGCVDTCSHIEGCTAVSRFGSKSKKDTENFHCYFYKCSGPTDSYSWIAQNSWGNFNNEAATYFCTR